MKKHIFFLFIFIGFLFIGTPIQAQMTEGKVNKYYVVVGSYKSMKYANICIKKMEGKGKVVLFVVSEPNKNLFRVCYAQAKTKEEVITIKTEATSVFPDAWVLYL